MHRCETTWLEQLRRRGDGVAHGTVLVACSGGGDSVALLAFLAAARTSLDLELVVAHANHQLRREAEADAEHVRALCRTLDLELVEADLDVRGHAARQRCGLETAARDLRWAWLRAEAESVGALAVATGHTLDDHTETVLLRLLRNGGAGALTPLPARQGLRWSPLIEARRSELRAYLQQLGSTWREDASNAEGFTPRNRLRPLLEPLRGEVPALDRHLWETHCQVAELLALRNRTVATWRGVTWTTDGQGLALAPGLEEDALRWILACTLPELGVDASADRIRDLARWATPRLNRKSLRTNSWGGWTLSALLQPTGWRMLRPSQASKVRTDASTEAVHCPSEPQEAQ